jgi:hypothetical protein
MEKEKKMTNFTTLKNGVQVFALNAGYDFNEAQEMLDLSSYTDVIDAECAYSDRVGNSFTGTYKIMVDRQEDYERFTGRLQSAKRHAQEEKRAFQVEARSRLVTWFHSLDSIAQSNERAWTIEELEKIDRWYYSDANTCSCSVCEFRLPTIEEWKTGKYNESEKRVLKLGKAMRKAGFSQEIIDFYSLQTKTEKSVYLTISDRPQHIVGMSNYAEMGTWDGFGGTSCQDTRHDEDYAIKLAGSLHDDKLFIGMLHDSLEDLHNMQDKLKARTMLRYMTINGKGCLIATSYYGNNDTKDMLGNALKALEEVDIYSNSVLSGNREWIEERTNGAYELTLVDEVHVYYDEWENITCECPACGGSGEMEVYSNRLDRHVDIDCPACGGSGEYEEEVHVHVDTYEEVEDSTNVLPYAECYSHYGYKVEMGINVTEIERARIRHEMTEEEMEELGRE